MRSKIYLPKTMEELKSLKPAKLFELWKRYSPYPYQHIKALWYYIACENTNRKIKPAYIAKLNKYAEKPEECLFKVYKTKYQIPSGTEIIKNYKGRTFKVLVRSDKDFIFNDTAYNTLSAVALAICGTKVSGYDFFGLNNKKIRKGDQND